MVPMKILAATISQVLGSPLHPTHASISGGAWTPAQLYLASEQGAWYGPSDFSTMFQDAAGTTPVTAVEQPVGLMLDLRLGLVRGVELLTGTANYSEYAGNGSISFAGGVITCTRTGAGPFGVRLNSYTSIGVHHYEMAFDILTNNSGLVILSYPDLNGGETVFFGTGAKRHICRNVTNGTTDAAIICSGGTIGDSFTISPPSLKALLGNHASQATSAARPVLQQDGNGKYYVAFDGVDDFLRTTFPNLGSSVTIGRSIPGTGASILTGQTIGSGNWDDSTSHCALVIIDRALTGPETTLVTDYLNARAGL